MRVDFPVPAAPVTKNHLSVACFQQLKNFLNFGSDFVGLFGRRRWVSAHRWFLGVLAAKQFAYKPEWLTHRFPPIANCIGKMRVTVYQIQDGQLTGMIPGLMHMRLKNFATRCQRE